MNKKHIIISISAITLVFGYYFVFKFYLSQEHAIELNLNLNHSKLIQNSAKERVSTSDLPICKYPPTSEISLLQFTKRSKHQNLDIEFSARYDTQKLPTVDVLYLNLKSMLDLICKEQSYPNKTELILPKQIWSKIPNVNPQPYTYYTGNSYEYYSISIEFKSPRGPYQSLEDCQNQVAFMKTDEIVFRGFKKLGSKNSISGISKIICAGQFDSLDHWDETSSID
jgi:hypothetical protein